VPAISTRHRAEYWALRLIAAVTAALPYRLALSFGRLHADLAFATIGFRLTEARRRVRAVFGDRFSEREITAVCRQSWRNVVLNGIEMMRVGRADRAWAQRHCDCEAYVTMIRAHLATGRGALLACGHMGSWEMASVVSHLHGIPIFSIGARQKNPLADAYIHRLRQRPGIQIIPRGDGAMKEVIRKIRSGQALGILPDVRSREPGYRVPFLGGEANIHKGVALFAMRADCPVFPVIAKRHGLSRHSLTVHPPIRPDAGAPKKEEGYRITAQVMAVLDQAIRNDPGQWFWYNKRWVLDPL
jgi:Kdo2-lipid IVA lauroyltransferase/acyltransferase